MTRTRLSALLGALAVAALAAGVAPPAHAHGVVPGQRLVVDSLEPPVPALEVWGASLVGEQLVVRNNGSEPVEVLDGDGAPFLRIGPDGVDANRASPAWYLANAAVHTTGAVPSFVDGSGAPDWVHVADDPQWAWYDSRVHSTAPGQQLQAAEDDLRLADWTVPLRVGDRVVQVNGHGAFRPVESRPSSLLDAAPDIAGLELITVPDGPLPALQAIYSGTETITFLGVDGEPFARFGPDGVSVNEASPTWLLTMGTRSEVPTGVVDSDAEPRWSALDTRSRLSWLDPRLQLRTRDDGTDAELDERRWTIPIETAGGIVEATGRTVLVDIPRAGGSGSGSGSGWWLWLGVAATVLVAGVIVIARLRRARR